MKLSVLGVFRRTARGKDWGTATLSRMNKTNPLTYLELWFGGDKLCSCPSLHYFNNKKRSWFRFQPHFSLRQHLKAGFLALLMQLLTVLDPCAIPEEASLSWCRFQCLVQLMVWENRNFYTQQNPKPAPTCAPDIQKLNTSSILSY